MPPHTTARPAARLAPVAGLVLALLGVAGSSVSPCRAYDVLTFDGKSVDVQAIALLQDSYVLVTAAGPVPVRRGEIDFYRTFVANLSRNVGNVVVFENGSFLRYEAIEVQGGWVTIDIGGGGTIRLGEGLIDFEATVVEGAMVRLPASVGNDVAVTRTADRGSRRKGRSSSSASRSSSSSTERDERRKAARERLEKARNDAAERRKSSERSPQSQR